MTRRMEQIIRETLAEHTAAPGVRLREGLSWVRANFGRDAGSAAARLALSALLDHVRELDGAEAAAAIAAHGVQVAREGSAPSLPPGRLDAPGVGALALAVSGRVLDDLQGIQERHGREAVIACATACAANAVGVVLDVAGGDALDPVMAKLREAGALRRDRPRPRSDAG